MWNQRMCTRCSFKLLLPVCAQSLAALLSLFIFPRSSSAAPSAALVLLVPVPSKSVTLIDSATHRAPRFGQEDEQQLCSPKHNTHSASSGCSGGICSWSATSTWQSQETPNVHIRVWLFPQGNRRKQHLHVPLLLQCSVPSWCESCTVLCYFKNFITSTKYVAEHLTMHCEGL